MSSKARLGADRIGFAALLAVLLSLVFTTGAWAGHVDYDGDGAIGNDCQPFDPAVAPGKPDKPDLSFEDTNCDGIDGDESKAIFVAGLAGNNANSDPTIISGTRNAVFADSDQGAVLQLLTLRSVPDAGHSAYGLRAVAGSKVALVKVTTEPGNATAGKPGLTPATPPTPSGISRTPVVATAGARVGLDPTRTSSRGTMAASEVTAERPPARAAIAGRPASRAVGRGTAAADSSGREAKAEAVRSASSSPNRR